MPRFLVEVTVEDGLKQYDWDHLLRLWTQGHPGVSADFYETLEEVDSPSFHLGIPPCPDCSGTPQTCVCPDEEVE